jgi:hypothetical protein
VDSRKSRRTPYALFETHAGVQHRELVPLRRPRPGRAAEALLTLLAERIHGI